jgi:hypothetical protein
MEPPLREPAVVTEAPLPSMQSVRSLRLLVVALLLVPDPHAEPENIRPSREGKRW